MYDAADIQSISAIELVRLRPGMYIGGKDIKALHRLIEVGILFSLQDAVLGTCYHLSIQLLPGEMMVIRADGDTLPVDKPHPYGELSVFEAFMTHPLRREFSVTGYDLSFSLFGMGFFVINALSSFFRAEIRRGDTLWQQEYRYGLPKSDVEIVHPRPSGDMPGMTLTFAPDFTIFEAKVFDYDQLVKRGEELAYLIPGFTISVTDERTNPSHSVEFIAKDGLSDWIKTLNTGKTPLHDILTFDEDFEVTSNYGKVTKIRIAFVLQYVEEADSNLLSYVNTVETTHGGTHLNGFMEGLRYTLKRHTQRPTRKPMLLPGLTAIVKLLHPNPSFESQSRIRLFNPEVEKLTRQAAMNALKQHPDVLAAIARKFED